MSAPGQSVRWNSNLRWTPTENSTRSTSKALIDLANRVLDERHELAGQFGTDRDREALEQILSVGTSAGGARAKAVIAWNPETGEFRSGQVHASAGFEQWLLKFDGVSARRAGELADPAGYGRIEYAYYRMARAAGIRISGLPIAR